MKCAPAAPCLLVHVAVALVHERPDAFEAALLRRAVQSRPLLLVDQIHVNPLLDEEAQNLRPPVQSGVMSRGVSVLILRAAKVL